MSEVHLGMPGPWAKDSYEASDHYTTKIGGLPDWPIPPEDITPEFLLCRNCGSNLCLVLQVHAPISCNDWGINERVIYVLGCIHQDCGSCPLGWRILRLQNSKNECKEHPREVVNSCISSSGLLSNFDFLNHSCGQGCDNSESESEDDGDLEKLAEALSEAGSQLSSNSKRQNNARMDDTVVKVPTLEPMQDKSLLEIPVIPCFYIYFEEERSRGVLDSMCTNYSSLLIKESQSELDNHGEEKMDEESYEYDRALNADRTYLKFKKQVETYPDQCLRYSYGGKPLMATDNIQEPENCRLCGAPRQYELQLMSPLLYFLQEASNPSTILSVDWSWHTLLVYTCSKNCSISVHPKNLESKGWTIAEEVIICQFENSFDDSVQRAYFS